MTETKPKIINDIVANECAQRHKRNNNLTFYAYFWFLDTYSEAKGNIL